MEYNLLKNLKVLIVEDETSISKLLKESLQGYFYSVIIAKDGNEGIAKCKRNKPDIIISDIMMPNCDGLEMATYIKEFDKNIPIIILSAYSEKEKLLKAIDLGISKYFIKPFDPDELIEYLLKLAKELNKTKIFSLKDNFVYDNNSNSLYKNEKLVSLTKREKEFIHILLKNPDKVIKTSHIKKSLWTEEKISDERLRTFIKRLRLKTSKDLIENVSGQGYLISPLYK